MSTRSTHRLASLSTFSAALIVYTEEIVSRGEIAEKMERHEPSYKSTTTDTVLAWLRSHGYINVEPDPNGNRSDDVVSWATGPLRPIAHYREHPDEPNPLNPPTVGRRVRRSRKQTEATATEPLEFTLVARQGEALLIRGTDGELWLARPFVL